MRLHRMHFEDALILTLITVGLTLASAVDGHAQGTANPLPSLSALTPATTAEGGPAFTLTVTGGNFVPSSVLRGNGATRVTTFVDAGQLAAAIPAADIAMWGTGVVSVFTPAAGGGTSGELPLRIIPFSAFVDDFNRADSADLGNGWVQKTPGAFSLAGNQIVKAATGTGYVDNLVYYPDDMAVPEVSVEVRFASLPPGYAQVFVRGDPESIATPGVFSGYLLFTDNDSTRAILARINSNTYAPPAELN